MTFAFAHPVPVRAMELAAAGELPKIGSPGTNLNHVTAIATCYSVAYTVEQKKPPVGWTHHVSVSIGDPRRLPHPSPVDAILHALGLPTHQGALVLWEEVFPSGAVLNLLFPLQPDEIAGLPLRSAQEVR